MITNCIVHHIFDNFGLTKELSSSLKNDKFLLEEVIEYFDSEEKEKHANLYGASIEIERTKFRILVADFSGKDLEFAMLVKLENCPNYACYLGLDSETGDIYDGLIAFSYEFKNWLPTTVGIQATFLAGMENLKEVVAIWDPLENYQEMIEELKSFVEYQDDHEG